MEESDILDFSNASAPIELSDDGLSEDEQSDEIIEVPVEVSIDTTSDDWILKLHRIIFWLKIDKGHFTLQQAEECYKKIHRFAMQKESERFEDPRSDSSSDSDSSSGRSDDPDDNPDRGHWGNPGTSQSSA
ncbi:unnamed protein product [Larinioides sclopetarius]|uniref:Uncharacterized protein n=1 Tax=Larinioides sclopetarius TaxID=280406 RepID=A0AAV1Z6Q1_9ARAC